MKTALICVLLLVSSGASAFAAAGAAAHPGHDGQHDFDFQFGLWNARISKLVTATSGAKSWITLTGTHDVRKVWNGRANLGVLEVDGPSGHVEGMQLRLYNPKTHQWSLSFASSRTGTLGTPMIGCYQNGRGEFLEKDTENGRVLYERSITKDITSDSYLDEGATSSDGGKTWEVNWIARYTRVKGK